MSKTREKIIETAFLLFLKRGYRAVTLMGVVEAVGMTKGTFYYHFTNKKELLREGMEAYYHALNQKRAEEFAQIGSLREFVDVAVGHLMEIDNYSAKHFGSDIPEILCLSLLVEVVALYPEFKEVVAETKSRWLSNLERVISAAQAAGEVKKEVDMAVLAKNLLNIGVGLLNYLVMHQDVSDTLKMVQLQYEQLYAIVTE